MIGLIIFILIIVVAVILFLTWFLSSIADGNCPICALKSLAFSKPTMDISKDKKYSKGSSTPIMGWSSWNCFRNHIDEDTIIEVAKAMRDTGLAEAGYQYINVDDCWQSSMRDSNGLLQGDLESFPSGMASLASKINSYGLKMGLYTSNGTLTCEDLPASLGNEVLDAKTLASWGVEYFKYDFCHNEKISGKTPIIEYVDISRIGERSQIKLTPNMAKFTGRAKIVKASDLESKKGIGFINHGAGTATFKINVNQDGEYVFTIHYKKITSRKKQYMQILVNGELNEVFFPASFPFTPDARLQAMIKLKAGENVITLQNPVVTRADSAYIQYRRMGQALQNATENWALYNHIPEKEITYSICEWGTNKPYKWGAKAGNMWRTTHDITPRWSRIKFIYERTVGLYKYASPGHVNDPDMLEVGNGKLNVEENKSHFTLWCMMAAPLVLGNDLRLLNNGTKKGQVLLDIITNPDLIEINQDPLVKPCKRIEKKGKIDILARPLANGDIAICFFNKGKTVKELEFDLEGLNDEKYLDFKSSRNCEVIDIWKDTVFHSDIIKASIPAHGVKVYRISNAK